jgi:hypothetical protein
MRCRCSPPRAGHHWRSMRTFPLHPAWLVHVHMNVDESRGHHCIPIVQHLQSPLASQQRLRQAVAVCRWPAHVHPRNHAAPHMHCNRRGGWQDGERVHVSEQPERAHAQRRQQRQWRRRQLPAPLPSAPAPGTAPQGFRMRSLMITYSWAANRPQFLRVQERRWLFTTSIVPPSLNLWYNTAAAITYSTADASRRRGCNPRNGTAAAGFALRAGGMSGLCMAIANGAAANRGRH